MDLILLPETGLNKSVDLRLCKHHLVHGAVLVALVNAQHLRLFAFIVTAILTEETVTGYDDLILTVSIHISDRHARRRKREPVWLSAFRSKVFVERGLFLLAVHDTVCFALSSGIDKHFRFALSLGCSIASGQHGNKLIITVPVQVARRSGDRVDIGLGIQPFQFIGTDPFEFSIYMVVFERIHERPAAVVPGGKGSGDHHRFISAAEVAGRNGQQAVGRKVIVLPVVVSVVPDKDGLVLLIVMLFIIPLPVVDHDVCGFVSVGGIDRPQMVFFVAGVVADISDNVLASAPRLVKGHALYINIVLVSNARTRDFVKSA